MKGPADAYKSGIKRQYRREVWNALEDTSVLRDIPRKDRKVLILDEWMAHEAQFLVDRGYSPRNIVAANLSVATAARITMSLRSYGIEGVKACGGDVAKVWERLTDKGIKFDAIHLDFCGNLSVPLVECLEGFNGCAALGPTAIAINMLRGRESGMHFKNARDSAQIQNADTDHARRVSVYGALTACVWNDHAWCRQHLLPVATRIYKSTNNQTMLWLAGELRTHGEALKDANHRGWIDGVWSKRTNPRIVPIGAWAIPMCVKILSAGGLMTRQEVWNALDRLECVPGIQGAEIWYSPESQRLYREIENRKRITLGPEFSKFADAERIDPRRRPLFVIDATDPLKSISQVTL